MYIRDTIAAVSTPPGNGGIGIVRISGPLAAGIAESVFQHSDGGFESHRFYFGRIMDPASGSIIDEAMAVLMRAPRSYTTEDVLELQCHGSTLVVERVLALCLRQGARLAEPGEFTRRAFVNGRIDLIQAEAVMDIISSQTETALDVAQRQREGLLSQRLEEVRRYVLRALALVEAYIDFPEDDLGQADLTSIRSAIANASFLIEELLAGFDQGRILREGISVLIIGKPNAGKSSLLNRLLNDNRAIVTHIPGTTRDIIEETINLGGLPVRLLDTAGIRDTDCVVEQEGIKRALDKIPDADLVLFVADLSQPFGAEDHMICDALDGRRALVVLNKSDLPRRLELPQRLEQAPQVTISAHRGEGIESLKSRVRTMFLGQAADSREFIAISRARHRDALVSAQRSLEKGTDGLSHGGELELVSVDLRDALSSLGTVTGQTTNDQVLDEIFSSFCIGK